MKLAYLQYFHHVIFLGAICVAMFIGMMIQYNMKKAFKDGEQAASFEIYTNMTLKGLSEISI